MQITCGGLMATLIGALVGAGPGWAHVPAAEEKKEEQPKTPWEEHGQNRGQPLLLLLPGATEAVR